jgi:hypothetical protein
MAQAPGRQPFAKATHAKMARKGKPGAAAKRSHGALGPQRVGATPGQTGFHRPKETSYAFERCRSINPNAYVAPFNRKHSPHEARSRRPAGWTAIWVTLPKITVEALQQVAITLAESQQHSPWPRERRRYPRTKSHLIGEALDDFFRKLGFEEFCLQPQEGDER